MAALSRLALGGTTLERMGNRVQPNGVGNRTVGFLTAPRIDGARDAPYCSRSMSRHPSATVSVLLVAACAVTAPAAATSDPIATELERWQQFVRTNPATDEEWKGLKAAVEPALAQAEKALAEGRRWFALSRVAAARPSLAAAAYLAALPAQKVNDLAELEKEWRRYGPVLARTLDARARPDFADVPAAARAVGESALSEVQVFYDASLDYGRNTAAPAGFYYLGSAQGQIEMAQWAASIGPKPTLPPPRLRSLEPEINALEDEVLAAYRPPASIDSHPVFIRVNALLKQARELDAADLRLGALYRLLEARQRFSRLVGAGRAIGAEETAAKGREFAGRLERSGADPTLGLTFLENALASSADPNPEAKGGENARAIWDDVMPLYFAALGPAPAMIPTPPAEVTVTLLRWPYT